MKTTLLIAFVLIWICGCTSKNQSPAEGPVVKSTQAVQYSEVDEMPVPVTTAMPKYPEVQAKAGIEGTVWVDALVCEDGTVKEAGVKKNSSGSAELGQAALDAVKQYTFKPALKNNKAVAVWVTIPFKFKLSDDKEKPNPDKTKH